MLTSSQQSGPAHRFRWVLSGNRWASGPNLWWACSDTIGLNNERDLRRQPGETVSSDSAPMPPRLDVLSRDECLTLLASAPIGRVRVTMNALPWCYRSTLSSLTATSRSALSTARSFIPRRSAQWWPSRSKPTTPEGDQRVERGGPEAPHASRVVIDPSELDPVRRLIVDPWAVDGSADRTVRISSTLISGTKVRATPFKASPECTRPLAEGDAWPRPTTGSSSSGPRLVWNIGSVTPVTTRSLRRAGFAAGGVAVAASVGLMTYPLWRGWCLTWGTAGDEATRTLPGDDLLAEP